MGRLRVLVNGSYMAAQCTANQEPLAKFGSVPIAVSRESQDRPFAAVVRGAKADL
jgi:hypothetical protein